MISKQHKKFGRKENASLVCVTIFLLASSLLGQQTVPANRLADWLQHKLDHIRQNSESVPPDTYPTVMTEEEVNEYFAAGRIKLPRGVRKVTFQGQAGTVTTLAIVDFDEILGGQHPSNPMLSVFSGVKNVRIEADAAGDNGVGRVHVRSVSLDGNAIQREALELFVNKYLTPKYPNVGMDSQFQLPSRIDSATVGYHKVTVIQK